MPAKKKKFINKKEAVTFHLVHRSQKDPLIVDDQSSKHVLVESGSNDPEKNRAEQRKYGVFYDDDYDYMQHLRERNEVYELEPVHPVSTRSEQPDKDKKSSKIELPSSVFQSDYEKTVGLLNELPPRGPQPSWDPDIVEALDDDFNFEDPDNQLEDDFVIMAQQPVPEGESIECDEGSDLENVSDLDSNEAMTDDDFDVDYEYGDNMFMEEETKSRFTNYSMSSSVIRRSEGLTLLDDRFEKLYEEYDDEEIGALDDDDIDGKIKQESEVFQSLVDEFEKEQKRRILKEVVDNAEDGDEDILSDASDNSDTEIIQVEVKPEEKWDCESILSTYSNLYNHPKLISEPKKVNPIKLKGRHGLPEESIATRGLTEQEIEEEFGRERSDRASTYRPKGETNDEKTQRKKAIKEERRERRQEKKANKTAFKKEKLRQEKEVVNLNKNLTAVRIV